MISPTEKLILEAWQSIQEADFNLLAAHSNADDSELEIDPVEDLTKTISLLTIAAKKASQAKDLINDRKQP